MVENVELHLDYRNYRVANILMFTGIWIIFERLLNEMVFVKKNKLLSFEVIFILTISLKIFVYHNFIEPEIFLSGLIVILISKNSLYKNLNPYKIALLFLLPTMFYNSLYPFDFTSNPYKEFIWIPFGELFSSNILGNLRSLSFKIYVYGALVWGFYKFFQNTRLTLIILLIYAGLIEYLQFLTHFRVGGITEPLLVILLCSFLPNQSEQFALQNSENPSNE